MHFDVNGSSSKICIFICEHDKQVKLVIWKIIMENKGAYQSRSWFLNICSADQG